MNQIQPIIRNFGKSIMTAFFIVTVSGCAPRVESTMTTVEGRNLPSKLERQDGVVEYIWEEPMVDVIEVPPGLDPEGIYYRPQHQEIVEIRQGRWRYHRPDKK